MPELTSDTRFHDALAARFVEELGSSPATGYVRDRLAVHAARSGRPGYYLGQTVIALVCSKPSVAILSRAVLADQQADAAARAIAEALLGSLTTIELDRPGDTLAALDLFAGLAATSGVHAAAVQLGIRSSYRTRSDIGAGLWHRRLLSGHQGWVWTVEAIETSWGTSIASADSSGTVRFFDPLDGQLQAGLVGHDGAVTSVCSAWDGDELIVATAGFDRSIRLWDLDQATETARFLGHQRGIWSLSFGRIDGSLFLLSAGADNTIRLWDIARAACVQVFEGHQDWVWSARFLPFGPEPRIVSCSDDSDIRIWNVDDGTTAAVLRGHTAGVRSIAAEVVDGRQLLASASFDGSVRVWDLDDLATVQVLSQDPEWQRDVAFEQRGTGTVVLTCGDDGAVTAWDPVTADLVGSADGPGGYLGSLAVARIGSLRVLAAAGAKDDLALWNPATESQFMPLSPDPLQITAVAAPEPDSAAQDDVVLAQVGETTVCRFDLNSLRPVAEPPVTLPARCVAVASGVLDRRPVGIAGLEDGSIVVIPADSATAGSLIGRHEGTLTALAAHSTATRSIVVSGGRDGCVGLWEIGADKPIEVHRHDEWIRSLAIHVGGDGVEIASGCYGGWVRLSDAGGRTVGAWQIGSAAVTALGFVQIAGEKMLLAGDADGTVRTLDRTRPTVMKTLATVPGMVTAIATNRRHVLLAADAAQHLLIDRESSGRHQVLTQVPVTGATARADGFLLATGSGLIALTAAADGQEVR